MGASYAGLVGFVGFVPVQSVMHTQVVVTNASGKLVKQEEQKGRICERAGFL